MTKQSNKAPKVKWYRNELACGTMRHRLYINGAETPFFIDVARHHAHRVCGSHVGLLGSGMGASVMRRDGTNYRIAGILGCFDAIAPAKMRAVQLATA